MDGPQDRQGTRTSNNMSISALLGPEIQFPQPTIRHSISTSSLSDTTGFFTLSLPSPDEIPLQNRPPHPIYPSAALERYRPTGTTPLNRHDAIPPLPIVVGQSHATGLTYLAEAAVHVEENDTQGIKSLLRLKEQRDNARQRTGHGRTRYIFCPFRLCDPEKYNARVYPSCAQGFRDMPAVKYSHHDRQHCLMFSADTGKTGDTLSRSTISAPDF